MTREYTTEAALVKYIQEKPTGSPITINFQGSAVPITVQLSFLGGWSVQYTIIPGMKLELIKGEDGFLTTVQITINPNPGLHSAS